ncbi:MAG TPA: hypothetical protein PLR71_09300 [Deltaproteobacteria bacterium]|nr:hypothetical protein [Deltaproteobacteria bacterium]
MRRLIVMALIWLVLGACSDDSAFETFSSDTSNDSETENASIALDKGDYEQVIFLLEYDYDAASPDPASSRLLASAYMGIARVDPVRFAISSQDSTKATFDKVSSLLNTNLMDPNMIITYDNPDDTTVPQKYKGSIYTEGTEVTPDTLNNVTKAKGYFMDLVERDEATDDDEIQLGLVSAVHFVLYLGSKTADGINYTYQFQEDQQQPGMVPVPINAAAYWLYRTVPKTPHSIYWTLLNASDFVESSGTGSGLPSYQDDCIRILHAVHALSAYDSGGSTMKETLDAFLYEVLDADQDEEITEELIRETLTPERMYQYVSSF